MSIPTEDPTAGARHRLRRHAERGVYEAEAIRAILDEGLVAHVGVNTPAGPIVLPMAYGLAGDQLYLHGAVANDLLRHGLAGDICVTVTLLDGLVLARSWFHHSMNFRSVTVFGRPRLIEEPEEKLVALRAVVDHLAAGRSGDARPPSPSELRSTLVVGIGLEEASAKVRRGGPIDDEEDLGLEVWAGVVPLALRAGPALDDPSGRTVSRPGYAEAHPGRGSTPSP